METVDLRFFVQEECRMAIEDVGLLVFIMLGFGVRYMWAVPSLCARDGFAFQPFGRTFGSWS